MRQGDAVIIGVGTFRDYVPDGKEVPVGTPAWHALEFVEPLVPRVRDALGQLGYRVRCSINPVREELRDALQPADAAAAGGHRVVHVISHGQADPVRMRLDMVPADGRIGRDTDVVNWISDSHAERRPSLFLVDLCGSGVAARLPTSVFQAGEQTYAWVIAASDGREEAYDGRFSRAVADVLEDLARTGLGTDPSWEFVTFRKVARHIGMRLETAEGPAQTVRATLMDPSAPTPELPFFPNPAHPAFAADPVRTRRAALDPPVRDFLEELEPVDARHFTDKPGRHFTGRRSQLRLLAPWLDDPDASRLCVVTGSPGTGKSALLGALLCAAHPQLAEQAAHIRERLPGVCRPALHERLAAVQARQRSLPTVLTALARQLNLAMPDEEWSAQAFMEAVRAMPDPPVLVVDALDEAVNPAQVTEGLLLPLTSACRKDGRPVCRVLLGMRPWERFHQLKARAKATGLFIDLDGSPTDELEEDLAAYLDDVLSYADGYRSGPARPVRELLARTAAARLVCTPQQGQKWGEFLVASVFSSYLVSVPAAQDTKAAADLGASVPVTLPDVFELDLASRRAPETVRALLVAIAHAKGDGIPVELAYPLAQAIRPESDGACLAQILDESMFYVRTNIDTDGTRLYRPFHEGLAEYLRAHPHPHMPGRDPARTRQGAVPAADLVCATLLTSNTNSPQVIWANAAPYLLRHAIEHAVEAGQVDALIASAEFLVHADPHNLVPALRAARTEEALVAAAVYRASVQHHRTAIDVARRMMLALDAARYGATELYHQLTEPLAPSTWQPRWATGGTLHSGLLNTLTDDVPWGVDAVACTSLDGRPVAVTGGTDVRIWDLVNGQPIGQPLTYTPVSRSDGRNSSPAVLALACAVVDGRTICITGSGDTAVRVWDLNAGQLNGQPLAGHTKPVSAVASTVVDGRFIAVTGSRDGTARIWDLMTGQLIGPPLAHTSSVNAVACAELHGRPIAVIGCDDGMVLTWDLTTGEMIGSPIICRIGQVGALACTVLDGRPVVVVNNPRKARIFDLTTGEPINDSLASNSEHFASGAAVACTVLDGHPIAVIGQNKTVQMWDLATLRPIGSPLVGHSTTVSAVACTTVDGLPVAVTGSHAVRVWDLATSRSVGRPREGHADEVQTVACTVLNGQPVAVTGSATDAMIWDLDRASGRPLSGFGRRLSQIVCTVLEDRPVAVGVISGYDELVRVWDLATGETLARLRTDHDGIVAAVACTVLDGRTVAVTAGFDETVRVTDLATGRTLGQLSTGHVDGVISVVCTVLDGRPVAVTGSRDRTVRISDLVTGQLIGQPITGHIDDVDNLACTVLDGRPVAVASSCRQDQTLRVWDLATGQSVNQPLVGHTSEIRALTCTVLEGRPVAVTGSRDRTVRIWDLSTASCEVIPVVLPVNAIAVAPDGALVIGMGNEIAVLEQKKGNGLIPRDGTEAIAMNRREEPRK
ncbi:AAA family ATPase [Streptomyces mirabilis]|uniref:AAA family ATPase n=1 Tax=Streptomyces mirabilis TaxID=68239 RepID=UPI0036584F98